MENGSAFIVVLLAMTFGTDQVEGQHVVHLTPFARAAEGGLVATARRQRRRPFKLMKSAPLRKA
jgi:hypothetical protein